MADNLKDLYAKAARYGELSKAGPRRPDNVVFAFLADSAGLPDMGVNTYGGTDSSHAYEYTVGSGFMFEPERINFAMIDGGITQVLFGGIAALTNGCKMEWISGSGSVLKDFCDGQLIKRNNDFGWLAGVDANAISIQGGGDDALLVRWTLGKSGGKITMLETETLRFTTQDSLGTITEMRAMLQGTLTPNVLDNI